MKVPSVRTGLRAALLVARGRADGLDLVVADSLEAQRGAARHSFLAAALCVPVFLVVQLFGSAGADLDGPPDGTLRDLAAFAIGWLTFAVVSHHLAAMLGRAALWPRFITLWNWCNLLQYLLLAASSLPVVLGLPALVSQTVWIAAMGWAVWLEWFATRLALGLPGLTAAAVVGVDISIGFALLLLMGAGG